MSELRVLVAPDSFKGSLTSVQVARALADGWSRGRPTDVVSLAPLADGGEGTLDAISAAGGWVTLPAAARDPLMRPMDGRFLRQGMRAVVELATASGLSRVTAADRDGAAATTFGTGQILAAAIGLGCREIVLGLGGSATTDGGSGLLVALGARLFDAQGVDLADGRRCTRGSWHGSTSRACRPLLGEVHLTIASDVSNPLLGPTGAAAIYGPQKGLRRRGRGATRRSPRALRGPAAGGDGLDVREVPGAGAAGGTTASLLAIAVVSPRSPSARASTW